MRVNDVYPRRNLPGSAEEWGRSIEADAVEAKKKLLIQNEDVINQNRSNAATFGQLSRQVERLGELYEAIPKQVQESETTDNFGLVAGWNNVTTVEITVPEATNCDLLILASGQMVTESGPGEVYHRVAVEGVGESPAIYSLVDFVEEFRVVLFAQYSWSDLAVSPGGTIRAHLQVNPSTPGSYVPHPESFGVLTVVATFTG